MRFDSCLKLISSFFLLLLLFFFSLAFAVALLACNGERVRKDSTATQTHTHDQTLEKNLACIAYATAAATAATAGPACLLAVLLRLPFLSCEMTDCLTTRVMVVHTSMVMTTK